MLISIEFTVFDAANSKKHIFFCKNVIFLIFFIKIIKIHKKIEEAGHQFEKVRITKKQMHCIKFDFIIILSLWNIIIDIFIEVLNFI